MIKKIVPDKLQKASQLVIRGEGSYYSME